MATTAPATQTSAKPTVKQVNDMQTSLVIANSVPMKNQIFSQTYATTTATPVVTIQPRNVGLIKRFLIRVDGTMNNTDGANGSTLSALGLANLFSQISFTDLQNNVRIQSPGWHLSSIYTAKHKWPLGMIEGMTATAGPAVYGDNMNCVIAPQTVAKGASSAFRFFLEIPLAYSDEDLRGAIYANVVNSTMALNLTFNTAPVVSAGTDSTNAMYGGAAGNITAVTITVYQEYLDQLPRDSKGNLILPQLSLATVYEIKASTFAAFVAGADFPIPYANFRDFVSTFVLYNSDGSADSGRNAGTDLNYFSLQSANFTNLWKVDPFTQALDSRKLMHIDWPKGLYYFSSRKKPINTSQYGNMQLNVNAKTAAAGAYALVGWEDFGLINTLTQAGSLPSS